MEKKINHTQWVFGPEYIKWRWLSKYSEVYSMIWERSVYTETKQNTSLFFTQRCRSSESSDTPTHLGLYRQAKVEGHTSLWPPLDRITIHSILYHQNHSNLILCLFDGVHDLLETRIIKSEKCKLPWKIRSLPFSRQNNAEKPDDTYMMYMFPHDTQLQLGPVTIATH